MRRASALNASRGYLQVSSPWKCAEYCSVRILLLNPPALRKPRSEPWNLYHENRSVRERHRVGAVLAGIVD